jgi:hypothetical protein
MLCQDPIKQRLEFSRGFNPKPSIFNLGNNANYVGLKITTILEQAPTLLPNTNEMFGKLITLAQVLAKKLVVEFKNDDEGDNEQDETFESDGEDDHEQEPRDFASFEN